MTWIIQFLPLLVFVFIAVSIGRAINRARQQSMEHEAGADDSEEQRRVRQIQERIRRLAAERRGEVEPAPESAAPEFEPPLARRAGPEEGSFGPMGGPLRRVIEELERRAEPVRRPPPLVEVTSAELERQQRLAEEMRALEESRLVAQRRAAKLAEAVRVDAESERGKMGPTRKQLLEDLTDRQKLRRAFVLREVLGPPVSLR
jgi:hypothetical protein